MVLKLRTWSTGFGNWDERTKGKTKIYISGTHWQSALIEKNEYEVYTSKGQEELL